LGIWGGFRRRIFTSLAGLVLIGLGSLGLGLAPATAFPLAVIAMFVLGMGNPITNGPLFAIIQAVVEPDLQGRVLSLIGSASAAAAPLGLIIAGPVADLLGVRAWFLMGGILTLVMAMTALFIPGMMRLEDGPPNRGDLQSGLPERAEIITNPGD
jgi:DHA3 family macrolide efflux protein-like MFS transporter